MRILLTGASGFVGRAFIDSISTNDEVVCIGRSPINTNKRNITSLIVELSDSQSVRQVSKEIEGVFDVCVHLAAHVPKTKEEDLLDDSDRVNVQGTINLLEAFKGRFSKLVVGSTAEVFDLPNLEGLVSSKTSLGPSTYYGATKLASELIAQAHGGKNGYPVLTLRFSVMYGPGDTIARALPNFIKSALKDEEIIVVGGASLRDYVHIYDVVDSIHKAIEAECASCTLVIGTGKGVSVAEAAQAVVETSGSTSKVQSDSTKMVDIVVDTTEAEREIGFKATIFFPNRLADMIDSYR